MWKPWSVHDQHCQGRQDIQKLDSSFYGMSLGEEVRKVGIYLRKRYVHCEKKRYQLLKHIQLNHHSIYSKYKPNI